MAINNESEQLNRVMQSFEKVFCFEKKLGSIEEKQFPLIFKQFHSTEISFCSGD